MRAKRGWTRREFLRAAGLAAAGGALALGAPARAGQGMKASGPAGLPQRPNLLFIVTDQERAPQHWAGLDLAALLPARQKLLNDGLNFTRFYCNSSMCSPSRATLLTGLYPAQHGLTHTLTYNETDLSDTEVPLDPSVPNMARLLESAGYYVALKGKWHLSKNAAGNPPDENDVKKFGFLDWEPTTAGEATDVDSFGGGCAHEDTKIVDAAVAWLGRADLPQPFALFVMLANPHDVLAYPRLMDQEPCTDLCYANTADWTMGVNLPPSFGEDLSANGKPKVQEASLGLYNLALGSLDNIVQRREYVNFYAYLHTVVDGQIDRLLNAIQAWDNTKRPVIIRTVDHGEMGLSHGGLRQKMFNAYEETMHLPLIISHPDLACKGQSTAALASLVDLLPTVASLADAPNKAAWPHKGVDLSPLLTDPSGSVQDTLLFTFDDCRAGTGYNPDFLTQEAMAHHIHCIVHSGAGGNWKFARYFNPPEESAAAEEFEMYDLDDLDDYEQTNLAADPAQADKRAELAALLAQVEAERLDPLYLRTHLPAVLR